MVPLRAMSAYSCLCGKWKWDCSDRITVFISRAALKHKKDR